MLLFSHHLSLSHCHLASFHLFLKSLEQLCCYNLFPLEIKRALEESWSTGLGLGVPIYCEVKLLFESFCEILNSCLGKLVYLARCSNSVVVHLYVLYMLVI
jgi:hypothetical protein